MKQKLLLFFGVFMVLSNLILAPLSVFAQDKKDELPENERVVNKYGTVVVNKDMEMYNPAYIQRLPDGSFKVRQDIIDRDIQIHNNTNISHLYSHSLHLERAFCRTFQEFTINNGKLTDETRKADLQKGCQAIRGEKYKSLMLFNYFDSKYSLANSIYILVYTGNKDLNLKHYAKHPTYGYRSNMFGLELPESEFNNFIGFGVNFYNSRCDTSSALCVSPNSTINISVHKSVSNYASIISGSKNYFFHASGSDSGTHRQVLFSSFDYIYPEDFPEDYKIKQRNLLTSYPKVFRPYPAYSVKDKNLNASIYFDNTLEFKSFAHQYRSTFTILDSKKEKEIFSYSFDDVYSQFNYDFSDYGTYYLKTSISIKVPFVQDPRFAVESPVFTEILIDGGSYSFFPRGNCSKTSCSLPSYAENCYPKFSDLAGASMCEIVKLYDFFKSKFGILLFPFELAGDLFLNTLSFGANNIGRPLGSPSCEFSLSGEFNLNVCYFEQKVPALLAFVRMFLNGSLIFGLVIFLRKSISDFLESKVSK